MIQWLLDQIITSYQNGTIWSYILWLCLVILAFFFVRLQSRIERKKERFDRLSQESEVPDILFDLEKLDTAIKTKIKARKQAS